MPSQNQIALTTANRHQAPFYQKLCLLAVAAIVGVPILQGPAKAEPVVFESPYPPAVIEPPYPPAVIESPYPPVVVVRRLRNRVVIIRRDGSVIVVRRRQWGW